MGKRYKAEEIVMKLREIELSIIRVWMLSIPAGKHGFQTKVVIAGEKNTAV